MSKQQKADKKKTVYKVKNWAQYNRSLINRGSLTIWITPEVLEGWRDQRPAQRGAQFTYSDLAIEALLALKFLLKLPYRATQGFGQSLFDLLEIDLSVPDYTTLSRRAKTITVEVVDLATPSLADLATTDTLHVMVLTGRTANV